MDLQGNIFFFVINIAKLSQKNLIIKQPSTNGSREYFLSSVNSSQTRSIIRYDYKCVIAISFVLWIEQHIKEGSLYI